MDQLVLANLRHRPTRTIISIVGIALGVCLTLLTIGMVQGMIKKRAQREANVGAEIMVRESGSLGLRTWASLLLPVEEAAALAEVEGVRAVVPVGQYSMSSQTGFGLRIIEGIPETGYQEISGIVFVQGRMFHKQADEAIVDIVYAQSHHLTVNDRIEVFGRPFRVVGIYTPESGPRIKVSLEKLQEYTGLSNKCSAFLVKCERPEEEEVVARRIHERFPDRQVLLTRDLPVIYSRGTTAINVFLDVVVGLEAVIGVLVILLTMYTAVKERTREIGILKSLGASRSFIISVIEKEAFLLSLLGVGVGFVVSLGTKFILQRTMDMAVAIEPRELFLAMVIGLSSGLLGALYPAFAAANQDAVRALSYE